ncbi:peptidoglycan DD-metalloendopeptidase family protein [Thalassotalea sp. LPB0316]|uniref:M23 family metallopeptidase n=1 Tax=Thalassotalea sp. LPB0316 TaxID=2769490 RepID=UPI001868DC56|nr:M23 family metallopeptidase [Thalassotalea sp. LPB0316]QOL25895.1 peptidoglycan DD-metalloendopeptidase family protein [Thalassotalea sp. LPB0316]
MSLTLLYRGKNVRFNVKLNKLHWLSALMAFALISGSVLHLVITSNDEPKDAVLPVLAEQVGEPVALSSEDQAQITALTMKLAELQSQVLRLNALGDRLADENNIPEEEFNFQTPPPSGGPLLASLAEGKSLAQLLGELTELQTELDHEEKQLKMLESLTLGHHITSTSYLSGRPIKKGWLSSYFGTRKDPFTGMPAHHKGIDFAGKEGAPVIATASGVVSWSGERYGYGNLIEINHGNGMKTRYGHNKTLLVAVGDVVNKGDVIAKMGSTGRSTGPHVHYEILRNNKQINPIKYVYRKAK